MTKPMVVRLSMTMLAHLAGCSESGAFPDSAAGDAGPRARYCTLDTDCYDGEECGRPTPIEPMRTCRALDAGRLDDAGLPEDAGVAVDAQAREDAQVELVDAGPIELDGGHCERFPVFGLTCPAANASTFHHLRFVEFCGEERRMIFSTVPPSDCTMEVCVDEGFPGLQNCCNPSYVWRGYGWDMDMRLLGDGECQVGW